MCRRGYGFPSPGVVSNDKEGVVSNDKEGVVSNVKEREKEKRDDSTYSTHHGGMMFLMMSTVGTAVSGRI